MLDLDKYINNCKEVKLFGETIHVKEPTLAMIEEIDKIEEDLSDENLRDKRFQVAMLMINFNQEDRKYTEKELKKMPFEAVAALVEEIGMMRFMADIDPNFSSPSPAGKSEKQSSRSTSRRKTGKTPTGSKQQA